MLGSDDTIAAIGTARGVGALGIVRVSGRLTQQILSQCFLGKSFDPTESHRAYFGVWQNPQTKTAVDEVVVLSFANGRGYTGESSVDIICHGGAQVTELVLDGALSAGARLARPGEFTFRAVMNDKLDLAKAESVLEIIRAKTPRAVHNALNNIRGALSDELTLLESEIVFVLANLEASIDFTTEDIQPVDFSAMAALTNRARERTKALLKTYVASRLASEGIRVALVGKPNGGKSSILNALLGKRRSIVTDQPGTTRDTVEEDLLLDGSLFRLIDTAGLRISESVVEKEGIFRTLEEIKSAEIILYVVDSSLGLSNDDVEQIQNIGLDRAFIVFNKSDLKEIIVRENLNPFGLSEFRAVTVSTVTDHGVQPLRDLLVETIKTAGDCETAVVISTQRQKEGLGKVEENLGRAQDLLDKGVSPEFVSLELTEALRKTQEVLGKCAGDDVMDRVFKEFCIGK